MNMSPRLLLRASLLGSLLALSPSAHAASTLTDPVGDYVAGSPCGGQICEPWQDITAAEMTHVAGGLRMGMTLAAPIPGWPALPNGIKSIVWAWRLDTDPATSPSGYPLPPGIDSPFEVVVQLQWNGQAFSGQVIDRRPLLSGGQAMVLPVTANVSGNALDVMVPGGLVNLPEAFRWRASTNAYMSDSPSQGQYPVDNTVFVQLNPGD